MTYQKEKSKNVRTSIPSIIKQILLKVKCAFATEKKKELEIPTLLQFLIVSINIRKTT